MNVIYDSENYYVVEYGDRRGYELVDKHTQRGTFFQGDVAAKFARCMRAVVAEQDVSVERLDEFLGSFDVLMNQRVLCH